MAKMLLKRALKMLLGNQSLQIQLIFWLAKLLVESTENTADDKLLEVLREAFGDVDTGDLD